MIEEYEQNVKKTKKKTNKKQNKTAKVAKFKGKEYKRTLSALHHVSPLRNDSYVFFQQELCRQAKIEYAEETRKAQELHAKIKAEVAKAKYNKHYGICWEVGCWELKLLSPLMISFSRTIFRLIFARRFVGRFSLIIRSLSRSDSD